MWKPVIAEYIKEDVFKILDKTPLSKENGNGTNEYKKEYDPEFEEWEFKPGSLVKCIWFIGERGEPILKAVESV